MSTKIKRKTDTEAKTRRCLMCHEEFPSEWAGNRICKKCKSTHAYRSSVVG